jgi:hypothetical protein
VDIESTPLPIYEPDIPALVIKKPDRMSQFESPSLPTSKHSRLWNWNMQDPQEGSGIKLNEYTMHFPFEEKADNLVNNLVAKNMEPTAPPLFPDSSTTSIYPESLLQVNGMKLSLNNFQVSNLHSIATDHLAQYNQLYTKSQPFPFAGHSKITPLVYDSSLAQYRTAIEEAYNQYNFTSHPSGSVILPYAPSGPSRSPLNRDYQADPSIERNVMEAQKFFSLIFHRVKKIWVDDWIKKAEREIKAGLLPKDKLEEAIKSIQKRSDNLPKLFSHDDLRNLQDLLDKLKLEGGTALKVAKECLINYAGNNIEHINLVVRNLLGLLINGKQFLGLYRGKDSYPPPTLFHQYVLIYTTTAPNSKRKSFIRSEEAETLSGTSLGYKNSPCDNLKCHYCLREQTNGQTGTWRNRGDAISCLISTLLSQESPWVCPAWLVQIVTITTSFLYFHPQLLIIYS